MSNFSHSVYWLCCVTELTVGEAYCGLIPGAARLGRRPTGVAHSKITRVRVLSWPLPVLTSRAIFAVHTMK